LQLALTWSGFVAGFGSGSIAGTLPLKIRSVFLAGGLWDDTKTFAEEKPLSPPKRREWIKNQSGGDIFFEQVFFTGLISKVSRRGQAGILPPRSPGRARPGLVDGPFLDPGALVEVVRWWDGKTTRPKKNVEPGASRCGLLGPPLAPCKMEICVSLPPERRDGLVSTRGTVTSLRGHRRSAPREWDSLDRRGRHAQRVAFRCFRQIPMVARFSRIRRCPDRFFRDTVSSKEGWRKNDEIDRAGSIAKKPCLHNSKGKDFVGPRLMLPLGPFPRRDPGLIGPRGRRRMPLKGSCRRPWAVFPGS